MKKLIICSALMSLGCGGLRSVQQSSNSKSVIRSAPSVVLLTDAPEAQPPSGKAAIRHLARGQNAYLGHLWIAPGAGVPLHQDPTEEYLYLIEGGGLLTMEGQEYQLGPGHTVYMPANAKVQFMNGKQPTVLIQVFAGPRSADKYERWKVSKPTP